MNLWKFKRNFKLFKIWSKLKRNSLIKKFVCWKKKLFRKSNLEGFWKKMGMITPKV